MAINTHRGERELVTEDGRKFALLFTNNMLATLEDELDTPLMRLADLVDNNALGVRELRAMTWAGLEGYRRKRTNHGDAYTLDDAGDVMDEVGFMPTIETVTDAFVAVFTDPDQPDPPEGEGTNVVPLRPAGGTGDTT